MKVKVASWNINSVRLRIDQVVKFLTEQQPDVLGLQEIKCVEEQFPYQAFRDIGYDFIEVKGQKGYHGAATVSKLPMERLPTSFCPLDHARHVSTRIIAGDQDFEFNIAPHEHDVWSHKQLLKVVSHTPMEVEILETLRQTHDFTDTSRLFADEDEKLYSWWSYRARDVMKSNRGRRLDHIWVSPALKPCVEAMGKAGHEIHVPCRIWEKP